MLQSPRVESLSEIIAKDVGHGPFQRRLLWLCGGTQLADACELFLITFLSHLAPCEFSESLTQWHLSWLSSVVFSGMLIGAVVVGFMSDKWGRRVGYAVAAGLAGVFGLMSALTSSFSVLLLCRFLVGVGIGGAPAALSLYTEWSPNSAERSSRLITFFAFFSVGAVVESAIAWIVVPRFGYRVLLFVSALPSLLLLFSLPIVPESPRFLMLKGRTTEAATLIAQAIEVNKGERVAAEDVVDRLESTALVADTHPKPTDPSRRSSNSCTDAVSDLVGDAVHRTRLLLRPSLRPLTVRLFTLFLIMAVVYYVIVLLNIDLIQLNHDHVSIGDQLDKDGSYSAADTEADTKIVPCVPILEDEYRTLIVTNVAELPGLFLAAILLDRIGRRKTIAYMFLATGTSVLMLLPFVASNTPQWTAISDLVDRGTVIVVVVFLARAFALAFNQSLWIYTTEVLPTEVRTSGLGLSTMCARIGGIICPLIVHFIYASSPATALTLCTTLCVAAAALCASLPLDTANRQLDDRVVA